MAEPVQGNARLSEAFTDTRLWIFDLDNTLYPASVNLFAQIDVRIKSFISDLLRIDPDFYNTHVEHLQPATDYTGSRRVPVSTLDSVVARHALQPPFAIKLDVDLRVRDSGPV